MKPTIIREDRYGWPSQARPDVRTPEPWSLPLLTGLARVRHHSLSPDGKRIAFVWDKGGNSDIYVMPAERGATYSDTPCWPQRFTFDRPMAAYWTDTQPQWSPDGRWLLYLSDVKGSSDVWAVPSDGGAPRRLTDHTSADASPIFSPDGQRVYFLSERGDYLNLCYTDLDGNWPVPLTRFQADCTDPRPSPDGRYVAFVYRPRSDLNRWEIWTVPTGGSEPRQLTGQPLVWDRFPRWSPDSQSIAFISNRAGWNEIWLLTIDPTTGAGSGAPRQLTSAREEAAELAWSPDGRSLAFIADRQGAFDLCLLDLASGQVRRLRQAEGIHSRPQWSPDGRWLTVEFESPLEPPDIYRVEVATGAIARLTDSRLPALTKASLVMPERVWYPSTDGVQVPALLYRPATASSENPCPAIIYPHGGPTAQHGFYWETMEQWLAAKGYACLAINYRGSTGYGVEWQHALHGRWGIVDTQDTLAAADYLKSLDWVDGERLAVYGASYGSYLAVLALARDPEYRFKCGVAKYGDCNILSSWAQGDRVGREDLERQMGHPTRNRAGYRAGSPVHDVTNIQRPLLIFHGDNDDRVHPKQSEELVEALKREGKTFEYVVYGDEGHGFLHRANLIDFYARLVRFLDWYLL